MKIDDIRSNIIGDFGLATSNQYHFSILPPNRLSSGVSGKTLSDALGIKGSGSPGAYDFSRLDASGKLSFLCDEINIPGFSVATGDLKGIVPGVNIRYAHTKVFNEFSATFLMDMTHLPFKVMQAWSEYIFLFNEIGTDPDRNYIINNYYDDYSADIVIQKLEPNRTVDRTKPNLSTKDTMTPVSTVVLYNAFPYTMANISFSNGPNQPVKFQTSFYYEYMKTTTSGSGSKGFTWEDLLEGSILV